MHRAAPSKSACPPKPLPRAASHLNPPTPRAGRRSRRTSGTKTCPTKSAIRLSSHPKDLAISKPAGSYPLQKQCAIHLSTRLRSAATAQRAKRDPRSLSHLNSNLHCEACGGGLWRSKQGCCQMRTAGGTTLQATFAPQGLRRKCDSNSTRSAQGVGAPAIARSLRRAAPTTAHAIATGANVNEEASLRATETATSKCLRQHVDDGASSRATQNATSKRPRPHVDDRASLRARETVTSN